MNEMNKMNKMNVKLNRGKNENISYSANINLKEETVE
jgi:hypothetical protein